MSRHLKKTDQVFCQRIYVVGGRESRTELQKGISLAGLFVVVMTAAAVVVGMNFQESLCFRINGIFEESDNVTRAKKCVCHDIHARATNTAIAP